MLGHFLVFAAFVYFYVDRVLSHLYTGRAGIRSKEVT